MATKSSRDNTALTLNFQGQISQLRYFKNGWFDWHWKKGIGTGHFVIGQSFTPFACLTNKAIWINKMVMMTSLKGNIFPFTGPSHGEFTGHRWIPCTKAIDAGLWCFFDLCLNKWLSKQLWSWWYEMPSCSLWCHCNGHACSRKIYWPQAHHAVNDNGSFHGQLSIGRIFHSILFQILVIRMDQKLSHMQGAPKTVSLSWLKPHGNWCSSHHSFELTVHCSHVFNEKCEYRRLAILD